MITGKIKSEETKTNKQKIRPQSKHAKIQKIFLLGESSREQTLNKQCDCKDIDKRDWWGALSIYLPIDLILNDERDSNDNIICSSNVDIVLLFKNWGGWGKNMNNTISWQTAL